MKPISKIKNDHDILRLKGILRNNVFIGPKQASIHLTNVCNLACKYCWYYFNTRAKEKILKKHLSLEVFKRIADDCGKLKVEAITFSGEGEPSLNPSISEMINYAIGKKLKLTINTNGTFNKDLREYFQKATCLNFNISEPNRKDYQKTQRSSYNFFNKILHNISSIAELKDKNNYPRLNIVYILNKHNFSKMGQAINLAKAIKADGIKFKFAELNQDTKYLAITKEYLAGVKNEITAVINKRINLGIKTNLKEICQFLLSANFYNDCEDIYFKYGYCRSFYFDLILDKNFKCYNGWYYMLVDIKGYVFVCCNHQQLPIGNIYKDSLEKIWNSKTAHNARLKMKYSFNIKNKFWKECNYCHLVDFNDKIRKKINRISN